MSGAERTLVPPRLLRAYRQTHYVVDGVDVRIGHRCAAMDALLARLGARVGVFVTAWNPLSRRMPGGRNRRMQRRLSEHLRRCVSLPAAGTLRRWHEAHRLVMRDPRWVTRVARRFRQRGIVVVQRGRAARLVILCQATGQGS